MRRPYHHDVDSVWLVADHKGHSSALSATAYVSTPRTALLQANAYSMILRCAGGADFKIKIGNHSFRATGITTCQKNGGILKKSAVITNHASIRTTQLYDRRWDEMSLDEVKRILIQEWNKRRDAYPTTRIEKTRLRAS